MGNHPAPSKEMNVSGSFDDLDVTSEIFKKKDTPKTWGRGVGGGKRNWVGVAIWLSCFEREL